MIEIPMVKSDSPNALVAIYLLPVDDFAPNALTRTFRTTSIDDMLKIALELALNSFPGESVQKIVAKVQLDFDVSKAKLRRSNGDFVQLQEEAGFCGTGGRWKITEQGSVAEPISSCPLCPYYQCRVWGTLTKLDAFGHLTEQQCFHVSECEMS